MKKPHEYLKDIEIKDNNLYVGMLNLIKKVQKEAIIETAIECVENVIIELTPTCIKVNKESIAKVAGKLIKELKS